MTYFNTTQIRGQLLVQYEDSADDQEALIALFFFFNNTGQWTPEDILKHHPEFTRTPITSIRRAFSNLQSVGVIYKTDNQIKGMYGRPIYTWRKQINPIIPVQPDLFEI